MLHESQSLLIEMQACRSQEFLAFLSPAVKTAFGRDDAALDADNLHRLYTRVAPGFIRVDADEITYPAHILLRYDLERAMIDGDLAVEDLPGAFADGMERLLGLTVPDDAMGCLQDIHWPSGGWGYFPTYTLGAITAAQLFEAATAAVPDVRPGLAQGDFRPLVGWLRAEVHGKGACSRPTTSSRPRRVGRWVSTATSRICAAATSAKASCGDGGGPPGHARLQASPAAAAADAIAAS